MNATEVFRLIKTRHKKDVVVGECKNGPTGHGTRRLDAWVMPRSWAKPDLIGYEIKVTRSDFMRDSKWQHYLPMCNELYFACAPGVADPSEMPEGVGLVVATKTGSKLLCKKKASRREIEFPDKVFRYVLMARCRVYGSDLPSDSGGGREYWENWLSHKKLDFEFGRRVGQSVRRRVDEEIRSQNQENQRLQRDVSRLQSVKEFLEKNDIDWNAYNWRDGLNGGLSENTMVLLGRLSTDAKRVAELIDAVMEGAA